MNSGLTIVGDIAYPFANCVNVSQLYTDSAGSILVGNLEGPILQAPENSMQRVRNKYKYNLYSSHSFLEIAKLFNEKEISPLIYFLKDGKNAGTVFDHSMYSLPNFRSRKRSSANIILS